MNNHFHITMLGDFSITNKDKCISVQMNRSKKVWSLLGYLILNRKRAVPCSELIDLLWRDSKSKNPVNALKVLVHRLRLLLQELDLEDDIQLITYHHDAYGWNTDIPCTIDIDLFEKYFHSASLAETEEEKLTYLLQAIAIYQGEFLNRYAIDDWIMQTANYYTTKFSKICTEAACILFKFKRYDDLIGVCRKALIYVPYDESFYIYYLKALVQTNQMQKALEQYHSISENFYKELGITPSRKMTALYKEIIKKSHTTEMDLDVIKEKLDEEQPSGAFYCEFEIFKTLYQLKRRNCSRTGESACLCLLSILSDNGTTIPNQKIINSISKSVHCNITKNLRKGDIFTRFSVNQFLIILPHTSNKTSQIVMQRIIRKFHQDFANAPVILHYKTMPLLPWDRKDEPTDT